MQRIANAIREEATKREAAQVAARAKAKEEIAAKRAAAAQAKSEANAAIVEDAVRLALEKAAGQPPRTATELATLQEELCLGVFCWFWSSAVAIVCWNTT